MEKRFYEAPASEVLVVRIEAALLQASQNSVSATRSGYGTATNDTWE